MAHLQPSQRGVFLGERRSESDRERLSRRRLKYAEWQRHHQAACSERAAYSAARIRCFNADCTRRPADLGRNRLQLFMREANAVLTLDAHDDADEIHGIQIEVRP